MSDTETNIQSVDAEPISSPADVHSAANSPSVPDHPTSTDRPEKQALSDDEKREALMATASRLANGEPDPDSGPSEHIGDANEKTGPAGDSDIAPADDAGPSDTEAKPATSIDRAREAMRRTLGRETADKLMDGMNDEQILERGGPIAKQFEDQQKIYDERERLRGLVAELMEQQAQPASRNDTSDNDTGEAQPASTGAVDGPDGGNAQPATADISAGDIDRLIAGLDEAFDENDGYIDDDVKSAMTGVIKRFATNLQQQMQAREAAVQEQLGSTMEALRMQRDQVEIQSAMTAREFMQEYGEVRNPDTRQAVVEKVYQLAHGDQQKTMYFDQAGNPRFDRLVHDAAKLVIERPNPDTQAQLNLARRQRTITSSQPNPGSGNVSPPASQQTEDERRASLIATLDKLRSGY